MCWDLEPRPGTTSVASLGWILYCLPPKPWNPNQPLPSALLSPSCHSLTLAWAFITHIKKIGLACMLCGTARQHLAGLSLLLLVSFTGVWPQLSWNKPFAHPQARYLVSCRDSCGKGRSLAQLPYPAPGHGTWVYWLGKGNLASSGPPTY